MKVITLCGSTKFKKEFEALNQYLTFSGNIVLSVGVFGHADKIELTEEDKEKLDNIHKQKINMSDEIIVIDKDNYIGESTKNEIEYASHHGKKVTFASNHYPEFLKE
jgi:hypothetical protein